MFFCKNETLIRVIFGDKILDLSFRIFALLSERCRHLISIAEPVHNIRDRITRFSGAASLKNITFALITEILWTLRYP